MILKVYILRISRVSKTRFWAINRVSKTQFSWSDYVWCGIFSTWCPLENRVSKTQFINQKNFKSQIPHLAIPRNNQKKKKKKIKKSQRELTSPRPGSRSLGCAAWVALQASGPGFGAVVRRWRHGLARSGDYGFFGASKNSQEVFYQWTH